MGLRSSLFCFLTLISSLAVVLALPSSLVDEIKASEFRSNKVKRAHANTEESNTDLSSSFYNKPTAIKRGANLKTPNPEQQNLNEWEQEQSSLYQNPNNLGNIPSSLYNPDNAFDDKTVAEYEKGFQYGINKDKLDQALENAVLKSELYGDPVGINQYRYYGNEDGRRRKRRDVRKMRLDHRVKREVELTPEEILTILSLYEANRQQQSENYRTPYYKFQPGFSQPDNEDADDDDENWLNNPVYPHANTRTNEVGSNYMYNDQKHPKWLGFSDNRKKRFMVSKKRNNDPTRELRYLNGPNKNDFYTLSQLLNNQREPNVPLYRRLVL